MVGHSASSLQPETPSLLSVLKALPADCVRSNLVSAFGRLTDADGCRARPPLGGHQWLPGQWTPVLYGLSHDWRTYARCVLTHTLTVDLAITVSLQRPLPGSGLGGYEALDSFLAGFPSLQRLTILAGNGGAPVDDSARSAPHNTGSSALLAMAEAVNVALAAQQLLRLDRPEPSAGAGSNGNGAAASSGGPRLSSLELRLHPAVWRALRGAHPDDFLQRLAAAHPSLEELALHVAAPLPPHGAGSTGGVGGSLPSSPAGVPNSSTGGGGDRPAAIVGLEPLAALPGLTRLRVSGPIVVEGLPALTQLQFLTLEGVYPAGPQDSALPHLTGLVSLRLSESHVRPAPLPAGTTADRGAGDLGLARLYAHSPAPALPFAGRLRSLQLPDVLVGPKEWPLLVMLSPALQELELANVVPHAGCVNKEPLPGAIVPAAVAAAAARQAGAAVAAAAAGSGEVVSGVVPDWFLRATVGDEAAYSIASAGSAGSGSGGAGAGGKVPARQASASSNNHHASGDLGGASAGARCPFAAGMVGGGGGSGGIGGSARNLFGLGRGASGPAKAAAAAPPVVVPSMPGLRRLVLWEYIPPPHMVDLLQLLPDLKEMRASLLLDDPPNLPAAALRPAAVATLRPLVAALGPLSDVRLTVSCDPAAVTGQLACIFLMECGMAVVDGIQGLSLTVWVAAEAQLGSLVALKQLRSLELTLGKQEQESELSVLTRLERLSYLSLRITPGIWNEIQGRTGRVTAGAALRLAMSFAAGQVLLLVADVHREICEDEAISLVKSVEMTTGQPGAAWAVSAWVEETAECIMGFGPSAGGSGTMGGGGGAGGGGGGDGGVLRVVWTPELVRRLLGVVAATDGSSTGGLAVSFMGAEEERLGRVLGS